MPSYSEQSLRLEYRQRGRVRKNLQFITPTSPPEITKGTNFQAKPSFRGLSTRPPIKC